MTVPAALRQRSRFEPSGLLWSPQRQRLLVVSDDTGQKHADDHAPWLFTMDRDGRVDPEPLPLRGVESISDLESMAEAPDGTVYLLASQSLSRKGRRPPPRQWLLRAEADADGLRVTGRVALYDAILAGLAAERRAELGVSAELDIEGLAWFRGGLLLGLKAPPSAAGEALLWYLADVDGVLDSRIAPAEAVSLFARLPLPTCAANAPGGISGLYLDGARLFVLSSLVEGGPCGAAWRVDLPLGAAAPIKIAEWPGRQPEGIARVSPKELIVVFDAGDAVPSFTRLDIPAVAEAQTEPDPTVAAETPAVAETPAAAETP
jgi:hypothetical protein